MPGTWNTLLTQRQRCLFGIYAFSDNVQKSKVTTNGITGIEKIPHLHGRQEKKKNSNLISKIKTTGKKNLKN